MTTAQHIQPLQTMDYVLIKKAAELTGFSPKAISHKIDGGVWVEGREWVKGPDGHRYVSVKGYNAWVERGGR